MRRVKAEDNHGLASMIRDVFHELGAPVEGTAYSDPTTDALYEKFLTPKSVLWVAIANNEISGCCGVYPTEGLPATCAEIVRFFNKSEIRGKGVGKALMEKCTDSARQMGYTHLYIESLPVFDQALRIYEKQGYQYLPAPIANSGHTTCNVWMLKEL